MEVAGRLTPRPHEPTLPFEADHSREAERPSDGTPQRPRAGLGLLRCTPIVVQAGRPRRPPRPVDGKNGPRRSTAGDGPHAVPRGEGADQLAQGLLEGAVPPTRVLLVPATGIGHASPAHA